MSSLRSTAKCNKKHSPSKQEALINRPTILVVENNDGVRHVLETVLRHFEFDVRLAASGEEALEIYRRDAVRFVLMDVCMPGMDGMATLAALKKIDPGVLCCFMSGSHDIAAEEWLRLGAVGFIRKPFHLEEIRQLIMHAIEQKPVPEVRAS